MVLWVLVTWIVGVIVLDDRCGVLSGEKRIIKNRMNILMER